MSRVQKETITPGHFSPDIREFIRLLQRHRVRYVIVGGEAVIFHGHIRFTGDVDFFYADDLSNVIALFETLQKFWNGSVPGIKTANELSEVGTVFQFGRPPHRIDLLNRIDGVDFVEAWETRIEFLIPEAAGEIVAFMLSREKLIQNKKASGRPKDMDDLAFLEGVEQ